MLRKGMFVCCLLISLALTAQEYQYNYTFFTNSPMTGDYYFANTTHTGNSFIKNINNKLPVSETVFHTPGNSLQ